MKMINRMFPLVVAMLAAAPVALAAQQPHAMNMKDQSAMGCMHDMMPGMDRHMGSMDRRMGPMNDSSMMARMHSELGLTDAQVQQMHTLEQRACAAAEPHMRMAREAHQAAMQALMGDNPSLDKFEDQLDKAAKHMVEAQVEMAKAMIEFHKSLTPAQRQKMDQMHQHMMHDMH